MRDKVSGAIAIPKASWGCAPALPNRTQVIFLESVQNVSRETIQKPLQLFHRNSCKILACC